MGTFSKFWIRHGVSDRNYPSQYTTDVGL